MDLHSSLSSVQRALRVGLAFNQKPTQPLARDQDDIYVEWDDATTIAAVEAALSKAGEVLRLEATADFPRRLCEARPDIVFNMAEGLSGANREAHIPAFCEFLNIPYTGSDPTTLGICLDKRRAKEILACHDIATPAFKVVDRHGDFSDVPNPPVIVKPLYEGSSKGITQRSLCWTSAEIKDAVQTVLESYNQPAIVERWLSGREFTCAVLGNGGQAQVLPIIELDFGALPDGAAPIYSYEAKWVWDTPDRPLQLFCCPARTSAALAERIERIVLASYRALNCLDWARIDVRCDGSDAPHILEVNPLPGIIPDPAMNSCFPKAARAAGLDYDRLILTVLAAAAARHGIAVEA